MINTGKNTVLDREDLDTEYGYEDKSYAQARNDGAREDIESRSYAESPEKTEDFTAENSDALPSQTAMQWFSQNTDADDFADEDDYVSSKKSYKISPRGKIMIAVYALVVATIVALIAINAKVLRNMEQGVIDKQETVRELTAKTQMLQDEYDYVSSESVISEKAEALGMTKVND